MPFQMIRADITTLQVDAVVNAANSSLLGGGGVDGCIHRAAGEGLLAECRTLGGCPTGEVRVTGGYRLPCRYVIHAVGPVWQGGSAGEAAQLAACYRLALQAAAERGCESIAFPLISAGIYGYPKAEALQIATGEIAAFLENHEMTVILAVFNKDAFEIGQTLYEDIAERISDAEVAEAEARYGRRRENCLPVSKAPFPMPCHAPQICEAEQPCREHTSDAAAPAPKPVKEKAKKHTLFGGFGKKSPKKEGEAEPFTAEEDAAYAPIPDAASAKRDGAFAPAREALPSCAHAEKYGYAAPNRTPAPMMSKADFAEAAPAAFFDGNRFMLDESFTEMLLRKIDESGMTDAECYKKANIDRKLFSKIRSNPAYHPGKQTVLAFAVALRLDLTETQEMLRKAGFALSHSYKSDIIIEYFIEQGNYDIYAINEALFAFDQKLLGA